MFKSYYLSKDYSPCQTSPSATHMGSTKDTTDRKIRFNLKFLPGATTVGLADLGKNYDALILEIQNFHLVNLVWDRMNSPKLEIPLHALNPQ